MTERKLIFIYLILNLLAFSCKKEDDQQIKLQLFLTDAPAPYENVYIHLLSLEFIKEGQESGTILNFNRQGFYDILKFTNGKDTLLGEIVLTPGKLSAVKLSLNNGNYVIKDGQKLFLLDSWAMVHEHIATISDSIEVGKNYRYWLDFDLYRSIQIIGNNYLFLKPAYRLFSDATTGAIKGEVSPASARPFIHVYSLTDTIGTIAGMDGNFLIKGVRDGIYTVKVIPQNDMEDSFIENIVVEKGKTTDAGRFLLN